MFRKRAFILIAVLFTTSAFAAKDKNSIQVKGSDTMVNLGQAWAEKYMEGNAGDFVAVTGGGSGTGFSSLISGTCDIAMASRSIKDKEVEIILQRMDDSKSNPTQKLTFEKGEAVRVIDGPFKDFSGSVEDINYEKSKLRVSVVIFGRATPVELEFGQVEKEV